MNPDTIPSKRTDRRTRYFAKNELSRLCLEILRKAEGKPIAAGEIAKAAMAEKGLSADERAVTEMVLYVLQRFRQRGAVVKHGISSNTRWVLAVPRK